MTKPPFRFINISVIAVLALVTALVASANPVFLSEPDLHKTVHDLEIRGSSSSNNDDDKRMKKPEPNPPIWPDSVKIFYETDDPAKIQQEINKSQDPWLDDLQSYTADKHFITQRTALLFAPGEYRNLTAQIGYYVQLAGLGKAATDVKFVDWSPHVPALNKHLHQREIQDEETGQLIQRPVGTCLDSFWRSAENFAIYNTDLQWAVSQAAPLRRVLVQNGDVYLHDGEAYASGGHCANSKFENGTLYAGGQQQFLMRNLHLGKGASGGAWSMVYAGCTGDVPKATAGTSQEAAVTVIEEPRVRIEKPYVALKDDKKRFELRIPKAIRKSDKEYTTEPLLDGTLEEVRDFENVRVARETDPVGSIQEALDQGKDVVLSPGIYSLDTTIHVRHPNQVLLGLGLATIEAPRNGGSCIHVAPGVPGVRIAGLMLEATEKGRSDAPHDSALLEWGDRGYKDPGKEEHPGAMFDIFVRVGGATAGNRDNFAVDAMMRLFSGNVVGDNLWIWRADHAILGPDEDSNYPHISPIFWQSELHEYRAETGIEVAGDDVTMYGLAVEHANGHQTVWSGERGAVHFYQCEFPYGVTRDFAENEFRGYLITENVESHEVHAPGIYSNFRNDVVDVSTAIEHPKKPGILVVNPFTVKLDNQGSIKTIINGKGDSAADQGIPIRLLE